MRVAYCTLGCKVNQYDTQAMRELFEDAGYETVDFESEADIYLVNTCTVTATGDKKSRQMISRAHSRNPNALIIVAGCYAQRDPREVMELPGVGLVIGAKDRSRIVEIVRGLNGPFNAVSELGEEGFEELSTLREGRARAHLKIQEGCDRYCTYCIIPYVRGPLRSRSLKDIRYRLEQLQAEGYREVVFTGIHLMSYGKDLGEGITLLDAIAQADGLDDIQRIRLGSLEPQLLTEGFVRALSDNSKVCRQFHLSMQSGSDTVLKRMNRRYDTEIYSQCVHMLRSAMPGCAITTDVIAGFPGETLEEHAETMEFIRRIAHSRLHVFPYSRRQGTAAYAMPGQLGNAEKSRRAAEIIELGKELEQSYMQSLVGSTQQVLLEEMEAGCMAGYTSSYVRTAVLGAGDTLAGQIVTAKIREAGEDRLIAEIIKE